MCVVLRSLLVALPTTVRTRVSLQLEILASATNWTFCRAPRVDGSGSRSRNGGRPATSEDILNPIGEMSYRNVLWGAPRLHGELLTLGIEASQATVAKYMAKHGKFPLQTWRTFLENHVEQLVSVDFFVVTTVTLGRIEGTSHP